MNSTLITDDLAQTLKLYTKLMRATNRVTDKMHRHLLDYKLSISQFGTLEALYHLGPLCQKDLGNKILKTSGNLTMVIDNLEKRGLVSRKKDLSDRRKMVVSLTASGKKLIKNILPIHATTARDVFSVLDQKEQASLGRLLKKLGLQNR